MKVDHSERAKDLFRQGYNCAQSVFAAFCDVTGMDQEIALKLASSFGGGLGRLREVCGAVAGMCMVAGLVWGYADPEDAQAKAGHYRRIQQLAAQFREQNGSIICRELLGLQAGGDSPVPEARTEQYYAGRPCVELVGHAAKILDAWLADQPAAI